MRRKQEKRLVGCATWDRTFLDLICSFGSFCSRDEFRFDFEVVEVKVVTRPCCDSN